MNNIRFVEQTAAMAEELQEALNNLEQLPELGGNPFGEESLRTPEALWEPEPEPEPEPEQAAPMEPEPEQAAPEEPELALVAWTGPERPRRGRRARGARGNPVSYRREEVEEWGEEGPPLNAIRRVIRMDVRKQAQGRRLWVEHWGEVVPGRWAKPTEVIGTSYGRNALRDYLEGLTPTRRGNLIRQWPEIATILQFAN